MSWVIETLIRVGVLVVVSMAWVWVAKSWPRLPQLARWVLFLPAMVVAVSSVLLVLAFAFGDGWVASVLGPAGGAYAWMACAYWLAPSHQAIARFIAAISMAILAASSFWFSVVFYQASEGEYSKRLVVSITWAVVSIVGVWVSRVGVTRSVAREA